MSKQISEAAWDRAARERVDFIWHGSLSDETRHYSGDAGRITREAALAAQAEIDREFDPIASNEEGESLDSEDSCPNAKKSRAVFEVYRKVNELLGIQRISTPCAEIRLLQKLEDVLDEYITDIGGRELW